MDVDSPEEVAKRTVELMKALLEANQLTTDSLISILFSVTNDITSLAPATGLRGGVDLADVPLLCVGEMVSDSGLAKCIRLMAHVESDRPRSEMTHLFLRGAAVLRPDLADPTDAENPRT